ncbi:MAG: hypothetical protein II931_05600 [Clostridia bacterium]|nr:hypothetical protein [Clostridia bacterium]
MKVFTKLVLFALALTMIFSAAACKTANKAEESQPAQTDDSVSRDVKDYTGTFVSDRCAITVEATDEQNVKITVEWGSSYNELAKWEMSGWFDPDTFRVNYSDSTEKYITYNDDATVKEEKVYYKDGAGRIQFYSTDGLNWYDEQHPEYAEMDFKREENPAE